MKKNETQQKDLKVTDKIGPTKHYKVEAFRKHIRTTAPHRHKQYFEIIYLSKGTGTHWIDGIAYTITPPVVFFLNRDQMHHWNIDSEPEGYVVIFKNSFLEASKDDLLRQLLQRVWFSDCLYFKSADQFESLFQLLLVNANRENPYQRYLIDGLLKALIASILGEANELVIKKEIHLQLYSRYLDLLLTQPTIERRVQVFAKQLNTTPQNLNAACRKATGFSASQILNAHVLNEAKRLILYTDNQIAEIAYKLSFNDPSYFVKFFKKQAFKTPEQFRNEYFQKHHY